MKKFILAICFATVGLAAQNAHAIFQGSTCMASCSTTVTTDSGHTGKNCSGTGGDNCECGYVSAPCGPVGFTLVANGGNCPSGRYNAGLTDLGYRCCESTSGCAWTCTCAGDAERLAAKEEIQGRTQ